jgi:hypothetical protein
MQQFVLCDKKQNTTAALTVRTRLCVCVFVCACVREIESERMNERECVCERRSESERPTIRNTQRECVRMCERETDEDACYLV